MRNKNKTDVIADRLIALGWHPLPPAIFSKIEADFDEAMGVAEGRLAEEITPATILRAGKFVASSNKPEEITSRLPGGTS